MEQSERVCPICKRGNALNRKDRHDMKTRVCRFCDYEDDKGNWRPRKTTPSVKSPIPVGQRRRVLK